MALFRKAKYDPFLGHHAARAAHDALAAGDWRPADQLLRVPGDRSVLVNALTSDEIDTAHYERWADERGDSTAWAMLGNKRVRDAWAVRGAGRAKTVGTDAWPTFFEILAHADECIAEANRVGPATPDAWFVGVTIARGRQLGIQAVRDRFQAAHSLHPYHANATASALQGLAAKWAGSHDEMFAFARWVTAGARDSSPVMGTIVDAHIERWMDMQSDGVTSEHYFAQPAVQHEIRHAAERLVVATPSEPAPAELLRALNYLLYGLGAAGTPKRGLVAELLVRIDNRVTSWPWRYWTEEEAKRFDWFVKRLPN